MKFLNWFFISVFLFCGYSAEAKKSRQRDNTSVQLRTALRRVKIKDYHSSSQSLFLLLKKKELAGQRHKIRYNLGLSLYNMGLYYPAVVQFQTLIRQKAKGYKKASLRKIAQSALALREDALLRYSIAHGALKHLPRSQRVVLHYHYGEYYLRRKIYKKAVRHFSRVPKNSRLFHKTLYNKGLAYAEMNQFQQAVREFNKLQRRLSDQVTNNLRVAAVMGQARSYYQGRKWQTAVDVYYKVPKDSPFWHDTLLERSWALLRAGRLRSALGNFQTLHSAYYTEYYQPESLLLRAIVYLYICKYFEMAKVLDLFKKTYYPVYSQVNDLIKQKQSFISHYQSLLLSAGGRNSFSGMNYPPSAARRIFRAADFAAEHNYIKKLKEQRDLTYGMPGVWRRSRVGLYAGALIRKKLQRAQNSAGKKVIRHLRKIRSELKDFFNQEKYLRYELLRSKRGFLKKKIVQKTVGKVSIEYFNRSFYIQNGYEYWPFKGGEYWLDELGNYHYVGTDSCK